MTYENQEQIEELVQRFAAIPGRLTRAIAEKTPDQLHIAPVPGAWTAGEVLAHMRAVDAIMTTRIIMLLARDAPPLVAFDERRWAEVAGYANTDMHLSVSLLTLRRAEVVAALQQLPPEAWQRSGQHETRGTMSVRDIVQDMLVHEEEHCSQIEKLFVA
ncbi:MAG: DinB family protein [Chloroflexota bacterium]|nr:DinB family protein [Chloroflexota bacterium]